MKTTPVTYNRKDIQTEVQKRLQQYQQEFQKLHTASKNNTLKGGQQS